MTRYLIVAHQTAESDELHSRVNEIRAADADAEFTLLVPATPVSRLLVWDEDHSEDAAHRRAVAASARLEAAGVRLVAARVGDADPVTAIADELRGHGLYATIIVSTLPPGISRWLHLDLPARLRRMAPATTVVHVVVPVRSVLGDPAIDAGSRSVAVERQPPRVA